MTVPNGFCLNAYKRTRTWYAVVMAACPTQTYAWFPYSTPAVRKYCPVYLSDVSTKMNWNWNVIVLSFVPVLTLLVCTCSNKMCDFSIWEIISK